MAVKCSVDTGDYQPENNETSYLPITKRIVEILHHTQTVAMFKGLCPLCGEKFSPGETIIGCYLDGEDHQWDCKTTCGAPLRYRDVKDDEGLHQSLREPCIHSSLHWVPMYCQSCGGLCTF